MNTRELVVL